MPPSKSDNRKAVQERHKAWVEELVRITGKSASVIGTEAGLSDTALTRIFRKNYAGTLAPLTIERVKDFYAVPGPDELVQSGVVVPLARRAPAGFGEAEQVDLKKTPDLQVVFSALTGGRNAVDPWRIKTRALELAGYLPGDIVAVDLNANPKPGDVVCAQLYNWTGDDASTVFRLYDPPFLVASTSQPLLYKPLNVDGHTVVIKGVVIGSARPWRASGAA